MPAAAARRREVPVLLGDLHEGLQPPVDPIAAIQPPGIEPVNRSGLAQRSAGKDGAIVFAADRGEGRTRPQHLDNAMRTRTMKSGPDHRFNLP